MFINTKHYTIDNRVGIQRMTGQALRYDDIKRKIMAATAPDTTPIISPSRKRMRTSLFSFIFTYNRLYIPLTKLFVQEKYRASPTSLPNR